MQVGVIGGGAWGTALSAHCARMGHDTLLWARESDVVTSVNDPSIKENSTFLKVRPDVLAQAAVILPGRSRSSNEI